MKSFCILRIHAASNKFIFATKIVSVFYETMFSDYVIVLNTSSFNTFRVCYKNLVKIENMGGIIAQ